MIRFRPFRLTCLVVFGAFAGCGTGNASVPADPPAPSSPPPSAGVEAGVVLEPLDDAGSPSDRGATLVLERGCARCHQSPDPDDGILSGQTTPRPGTRAYGANLTPDEETGIGGWSDAMILRAIRTGVDDAKRPLCVMPHFADLTPDEGAAIVAYLRGLAPVHREIPPSVCDEDSEADAADAGAGDAGDGGCGTFVGPSVAAQCHACGTRPCQPNGCFGGYFCETVSRTCHPAPVGCDGAGAQWVN